jgi:hypothetical protein
MKKLIVVCLMTIGLNAHAQAVAHPKLDAVVLTPQTEFTIPQFCDRFGWMLTDVVKLALRKNYPYTQEVGVKYVNDSLKSISKETGLTIPENWKLLTLGVLPLAPTSQGFKKRFFMTVKITEDERMSIYNMGFDTCLNSLQAMETEK